MEHTSCDACATGSGCGWCSETQKCTQGSALAPCEGGCKNHWTQGYCADWPCEHHPTCDDCLRTKLCGWCAGLNVGMAGNDAAPHSFLCPSGYKFQQCGGEGLFDAVSGFFGGRPS